MGTISVSPRLVSDSTLLVERIQELEAHPSQPEGIPGFRVRVDSGVLRMCHWNRAVR